MTSLYERGWRQGSAFTANLPLDAVVCDSAVSASRDQKEHGRWVLATQDCDLNFTGDDDPEPTIELRPTFDRDPPTDWGIRSYRYRLNESEYVTSQSRRTMISAALLSTLRVPAEEDVSAARRRGLKTWLGLRYDRPAVPESLLDLAKSVVSEVSRAKNRPMGLRVRDVLMQFDESTEPPRFSLYAVLDNEEDRDAAREWLATIVMAVPRDLGVSDELDARAATGITLHLVETSYSADVTQLTWRPNTPDPEGAE
jgi:hypothetical protein